MATQIGVITALIGTATVTALDGSVRQLQLGDKVYANDLITTGAGSAIEVEFADGSVMDMGRDSQTVLNNQVYDPSAASHMVAQADASVDAIQHAILAGQDPTKVASPTAAGNGENTSGDQVHAPIYVDYLAPEVTPQAGFPTTGPSNDFHQVPGGPGYNQSLVTTTTTTPNTVPPQLIVGSNASDNGGSTTPFVVSTSTPNSGVINGNSNGDILVGDSGGVGGSISPQNHNIVLILDMSGSVQSSLDAYKAALANYANDLHGYQNGQINVGIVTYSTDVNQTQWFQNVSDANTMNNIDSFINSIKTGGYTNYEAALAAAKNMLSAHNEAGYTNSAVFISDGGANTLTDNFGTTFLTHDAQRILQELTGTYTAQHPGSPIPFNPGAIDGNDYNSEIGNLHQVSNDINVYTIGVGVTAGSNDAQLLNLVASHNYISIPGVDSLDGAMLSTSPTQTLDSVGSDVINGGAGNDIIFGDSVNTDALAQAQGLSTHSGDGWDVFTRLENGEGNSSNWTRADTIQYIQNNHQQLAQESLNADGSGRTGGNDQLSGGQGNDIIYGQEGNDIISGGAGNDLISGGSGNDTMSGGSGNDTFIWAANDAGTTSAPAQDTITDFGTGDVLKLGDLLVGEQSNDITNYLKVSENGSNVVINVSPDGSGTATGTTENIVLQNTSLADLGAGSYNPASQQSEIINSLIHNGHISVDHS